MKLVDFPMDGHACPLKFGSCKSSVFSFMYGVSYLLYTDTHSFSHTHGSIGLCYPEAEDFDLFYFFASVHIRFKVSSL